MRRVLAAAGGVALAITPEGAGATDRAMIKAFTECERSVSATALDPHQDRGIARARRHVLREAD
jgi:hypothetical protein